MLDSTDEGEILLPELARQMMRRLVEPTRTRARLFDVKGALIADSRVLRGSGDPVLVAELPEARHKGCCRESPTGSTTGPPALLPSGHKRPVYQEAETAADYREARSALHGERRGGGAQRPAGRRAGDQRTPCRCSATSRCSAPSCCPPATARSQDELRTVRLELLRIFGVTLAA